MTDAWLGHLYHYAFQHLFRILRLFPTWRWAPSITAGHPHCGEFPFALQIGRDHRVLAALAHFRFPAFPARLSLHPRWAAIGRAGAALFSISSSPCCWGACGTAPTGPTCCGGWAAWALSQHQSRLPPSHQRGHRSEGLASAFAHGDRVCLTFAATTLAWIIFRAPNLASARNVLGALPGWAIRHRKLYAFGRRGALLLFGMVWFMPNSMEMLVAARSALPSPLCQSAGIARAALLLAAHAPAGRALRPSVHRRGAGAVEPQALYLFPVLNHGNEPLSGLVFERWCFWPSPL